MIRLLAVCLLFASVAFAQEARSDLASLLPADTLLLVESDDLGGPEVWKKETALGRVWAEPEVKAFVDKTYASLKQAVARLGNPLAAVGLTMEDFEGVHLRRTGFAIVDFRMKDGAPYLDAVLYAEARDGAEKLRKIAAAGRAGLAMPLGAFETAKMRGRTIHRKAVTEWMTLYMAEDGPRMIVTTQAARMDQLLAAIDGTRVPALASNPRFQTIFAKMGAKRRALLGYVDVKGALGRMREIMPGLMGENDWAEMEAMLFRSGFDAVDALAMADIPAGRYFRTEFAVTLREKRGMFAHGDVTPPTGRFLRRAPKGSWICGELREDIAGWIDKSILAVDPESAESFAAFEREFKEMTGVELRADLLNHMGTEWGYYLASPPGGGLIPDLVVFNTVKDRAKLAASIDKLVARFKEWGAQEEGLTVHLRETAFRGTTIRFLEMSERGDPIPIAPAWTFGEDYVAFALVPQTLKHALMKRPSILENEDFLSLRRHVPGAPVNLSYIDCGGFLAWLYNTATPVLQAVQGAINRELEKYGVRVHFEDLPPATVWSRHLGGMLSYSLVEDGIMRTGFVSPYGATVVVVVPVGFVAGAATVLLARAPVMEPIAIEEEPNQGEEDHDEAGGR